MTLMHKLNIARSSKHPIRLEKNRSMYEGDKKECLQNRRMHL